MALPIVDTPIAVITLPLSKKQVKIRAFRVKEEKVLLIAKDAGSKDDLEAAIKDIIHACTFGEVDPENTTYMDLVFAFIKILGLSKGDKSEVIFECKNQHEGAPCGQRISVQVNFNNVEARDVEGHSNKVMLTETLGLTLRYPTMKTLKKLEKYGSPDNGDTKKDDDWVLHALSECVEMVFDGDTIYPDNSPEELFEWFQTLTDYQVVLLKDFFETMPTLALVVKIKCPKCGYEESVSYSGLEDFFKSGSMVTQ